MSVRGAGDQITISCPMLRASTTCLPLLCLSLAGAAPGTRPVAPDIRVELAAVTLADDCAPPAPSPPPAKPARPAKAAKPASPPVLQSQQPGVVAEPASRHCEQTSMQLGITAPAGTKPTTIQIKKVELLDAKGKLLEVLAARNPTRFVDQAYAPWDEHVGAGEKVSAMYALTAPNWDKLTGGRWNAHEKAFQLRVTFSIGSARKTIDKQSITPVRLPPPVPT